MASSATSSLAKLVAGQLLAKQAGSVASSATSSSFGSIATGVGSSLAASRGSSGWRSWLQPRKRSYSNQTQQGEGKSIFDGNAGMGGNSVLEGAAEQRLQRIKAAQDAQGDAQASANSPGIIRQTLRFIGRTVIIGGLAAGVGATYYTYAHDRKELETIVAETKRTAPESLSGMVWVPLMEKYLNTRSSIEKQIKSYSDPTYDRLLPDLRPEMKAMGIKTLVLDLNGVLVSKQWTRQKGWSLFKRPGAQDFLFEMGQYFEVVIYTDEPSAYAMPVINKLDKAQVVPYRLFRPETQYVDGKHVRDLSKLNRDLSQVLFISADPDAYAFQPENTLKLKQWKDDPADTTLLDLLPMLQMIALKGVKDVRDVVKSYEGEEDVAKAFKKRMQQVSQTQAAPKQRSLFSVR